MKLARGARRLILAVTLAGVALSGCDRQRDTAEPVPPDALEARTGPWLERLEDNGGVDFSYVSGHRETYLMPEIMGGGVGLIDYDADGDLDIYMTQGGSLYDAKEGLPRNALFENRGDRRFVDVSSGSGSDDPGYGNGVAVGDYDNDGWSDLYVTNLGSNVLLRNLGNGQFEDVTTTAGVGDPGWGASSAFVDYDADGDLDLFVVNYIHWSHGAERDCYTAAGQPDYCSPSTYAAPARDTLFENLGDGTFEDVSERAGFADRFGNGLGVVTGDFDDDGRVDIFVANDAMPDQLWLNQGDGTFRDEALLMGCAVDDDGKAKAGMGVAAVDYDDDGDLDLLVGNLQQETDSFYVNEGGFFRAVTGSVGLASASRPSTRFGLALADFDNDGRLDLYQANGRVTQHSRLYGDDPFAEPNLLFRGLEAGRFREHPLRGGTSDLIAATSRAAAFGDLDDDGGVDIVVVNRDTPVDLLFNVAPNRGHWVVLRLVEESGRDALNARVRFVAGNREITREARAAYSYQASNDPRIHVGLGEVSRIDGVEVEWIDGTRETFGNLEVDRQLVLRRGEGQVVMERQPR